MTMLERLIDLGFSVKEAKQIINNYANERNWDGLELFVSEMDVFYDDRKQYPKEDY